MILHLQEMEWNIMAHIVKSDFSLLAHLTLNKELSDVTLKVGTSKDDAWQFPVHKFLLSEASPVFKAMFCSEFIESKSEVVITDITPRNFYKLLLFVYKGEFSVPNLSDMIDVVMAAEKYQMGKLISACQEKMRNYKISWENFWDLLMNIIQFCDYLIPLELKMNLLLFLDKNAEAVLRCDNFLFLNRETVSMIILRDTLNVSELVVCEALLDWAKVQCGKENLKPSSKNKRSVLKEVMYMIRLSTLERRALLKNEIYELLTDEETDAVMRESISLPEPWNSRPRYSNAAQRILQQKCISTGYEFKNPLYLVFAKDAYLHNLEIIDNGYIISFALTTQSDAGLEEIKTYSEGASNICVKAFVCYKINVKPSSRKFVMCDSWSYDGEKAVLFSIEDRYVSDFKKFGSPDYWKKVFARDPPVHDDGVICSSSMHSLKLNISATFC